MEYGSINIAKKDIEEDKYAVGWVDVQRASRGS